jgi:hypothetical protein
MSTRLEIEVSVSGLLKKHQIYGAPVPVDRVAIEEGLPIIEHALQGEVSGALISSNGVSAIAVNSAHHMNSRTICWATREIKTTSIGSSRFFAETANLPKQAMFRRLRPTVLQRTY